MPVRITALIPAFNAAATLPSTLDSVAGQSRRPDQVIVVDDGSVDETAAIVLNHRVGARLVRQETAGAAAALNRGIQLAGASIVALIDADDLWCGDWMAEVEAAFSTRRQDVLFGHMENFLCPSMSGEQARRLVYPKGVIAGYLPGACALRSDLFARVGGFDEKLRTGYFIEWMARARAAGVCERVSSKLALRRRIRSNTAGARSLQESGGLSADFLEIARRSIALKRNSAR